MKHEVGKCKISKDGETKTGMKESNEAKS